MKMLFSTSLCTTAEEDRKSSSYFKVSMALNEKRERMREGERIMIWLRQLKAILSELEPSLALLSQSSRAY